MKVVGIQEKKGNYQGTEYHNYLIHCLKDDEEAIGQISEVVKVKFVKAKEVFGRVMSADDFNALIGKEIRCYFDCYGVTTEIRVIKSNN